MRLSTLTLHTNAQNRIADLQARMNDVLNPPNLSSTDPVAWDTKYRSSDSVAQLSQFARNASSAHDRLLTTQTALNSVFKTLTDLKTQLRASPPDLTTAKNAKDTLLAIANTKDSQGVPMFSGSMSTTPFDQNGNYSGNSQELNIQISENLQVPASISGQRAFVDTGVFSALDSVINDISTTGLVSTPSLQALTDAITKSGNVQTEAVLRVDQISSQNTLNTNLKELYTTQATKFDPDPVEQITTYNMLQTQYEALLKSYAVTFKSPTLFDYIS